MRPIAWASLLLSACAPLTRDDTTLPSSAPAELAIVENVNAARVETMQTSAAERLAPVFLLAGPVGLTAAAMAEGDFATTNGREYKMRLQHGEIRVLQGFAHVAAGDCVLLRKDVAGRYMTPIRQPTEKCRF